jgi:hypothetical protein
MKISFAYYYPPYRDLPACASFIVEDSDRLDVQVGSNLGIQELLELMLPVPFSPTYEEWVAMGKPVKRVTDDRFCHVCLKLSSIGQFPNLVHTGSKEAV